MSDFTEKNRQYFEKMASTYKTDFGKALEILYRTVQARRHWASEVWNDTEAGKGKDIKMLEYACGPGVISQALAPYVTKVVGLDISDAMIDEYTKNARQAGLSDKIVGYKGDLLADPASTELSGPEFFDFDVVFISMALHHFANPELAMKRLAERMKKGGVCLIIDLFIDEGEGHAHGHEHGHDHSHGHDHGHKHPGFAEANETISRHGFAKDDMRKHYESAGLGKGFDYQVVEEPLVFEKDGKSFSKTVFIARGQLE